MADLFRMWSPGLVCLRSTDGARAVATSSRCSDRLDTCGGAAWQGSVWSCPRDVWDRIGSGERPLEDLEVAAYMAERGLLAFDAPEGEPEVVTEPTVRHQTRRRQQPQQTQPQPAPTKNEVPLAVADGIALAAKESGQPVESASVSPSGLGLPLAIGAVTLGVVGLALYLIRRK